MASTSLEKRIKSKENRIKELEEQQKKGAATIDGRKA